MLGKILISNLILQLGLIFSSFGSASSGIYHPFGPDLDCPNQKIISTPKGFSDFNSRLAIDLKDASPDPCVHASVVNLSGFIRSMNPDQNREEFHSYFKTLNQQYQKALQNEKRNPNICKTHWETHCLSDRYLKIALISQRAWYDKNLKEYEKREWWNEAAKTYAVGGAGAGMIYWAMKAGVLKKNYSDGMMKKIAKDVLKKSRRFLRSSGIGRARGAFALRTAPRAVIGAGTVGGALSVGDGMGGADTNLSLLGLPPPMSLMDLGDDVEKDEDFALTEGVFYQIGDFAVGGIIGGYLPYALAANNVHKAAIFGPLLAKTGFARAAAILKNSVKKPWARFAAGYGAAFSVGAGIVSGYQSVRYNLRVKGLKEDIADLEKRILRSDPNDLATLDLAERYAQRVEELAAIKLAPVIGPIEAAVNKKYSEAVCNPLLFRYSGFDDEKQMEAFYRKSDKNLNEVTSGMFSEEPQAFYNEGVQLINNSIQFLEKNLHNMTYSYVKSNLERLRDYADAFRDKGKIIKDANANGEYIFHRSRQFSKTLSEYSKMSSRNLNLDKDGIAKKQQKATDFYRGIESTLTQGGQKFSCSYSNFPEWIPNSLSQIEPIRIGSEDSPELGSEGTAR